MEPGRIERLFMNGAAMRTINRGGFGRGSSNGKNI